VVLWVVSEHRSVRFVSETARKILIKLSAERSTAQVLGEFILVRNCYEVSTIHISHEVQTQFCHFSPKVTHHKMKWHLMQNIDIRKIYNFISKIFRYAVYFTN